MTDDNDLAQSENDFLMTAHDRAKIVKAELMADDPDSQMAFVVNGFRGAEHVSTMFPYDRDLMLSCVRIALYGFGCDRISASVDAFQTDSKKLPQGCSPYINPDTGQQWRPGDLQRAFVNHRPWVTEAITTHSLDRVSGQLLTIAASYQVNDGTVVWDEQFGPTDVVSAGVIPEAFRLALGVGDMESKMDTFAPSDMTAVQLRAHMDAAVIKIIAAMNVAIMYFPRNEDVMTIVSHSVDAEFVDGSDN